MHMCWLMQFDYITFVYLLVFQAVEILDELVEKGTENMDVRNKEEVISRMKAAVASKQFGQEDNLCRLIAEVNYPSFAFLSVFGLRIP